MILNQLRSCLLIVHIVICHVSPAVSRTYHCSHTASRQGLDDVVQDVDNELMQLQEGNGNLIDAIAELKVQVADSRWKLMHVMPSNTMAGISVVLSCVLVTWLCFFCAWLACTGVG